MAKNCFKCLLPVEKEHPFLTCASCSDCMHMSCYQLTGEQSHLDGETIKWKCSSCEIKERGKRYDTFENKTQLLTNRMDEILQKITCLKEEQECIFNSLIKAIGDCESSTKCLAEEISSFQQTLGSINKEEQNKDALRGACAQKGNIAMPRCDDSSM